MQQKHVEKVRIFRPGLNLTTANEIRNGSNINPIQYPICVPTGELASANLVTIKAATGTEINFTGTQNEAVWLWDSGNGAGTGSATGEPHRVQTEPPGEMGARHFSHCNGGVVNSNPI